MNIRHENELLLYCIRNTMEAGRAPEMKALVERGIDWNYLIKKASQHGVIPQLYKSLNDSCPEAVPTEAFDQLRHSFHTNTGRNLFLTTELLKLLDLFTAHEIPAFPFKGPVLDAYLNQDVISRQYEDLDIMVRTQDVTRAQELLLSQGYQPRIRLTSSQHVLFLRSEYELPFVRDDGKCMVELHWKITPKYFSYPLDPEHLWERLEPVSLNGREVLTLSSEDLVLFLCMHGARHCWERLSWISDVATLISTHSEMDWVWVMKQAHRLGSARMLYLGIFLTNDLLATHLPEQVSKRVYADPMVKKLAAQVRSRFFQENGRKTRVLEDCFFHLKVRDRLRDKIRYCIYQTTNPSILDWLLIPLPSSLSFLHHIARPIRLCGKYGLSLAKRLLLRAHSSI